MRRLIAAGVMAAMVLASAGCADDPLAERLESSGAQPYDEANDERPDPAVDPALGPFIEAGNDACRRHLRPIREMDVPTDPAGWVEYAEVASVAWGELAAELRALTPPADDAEEVEAITSRIDVLRTSVEAIGAADPDDPAAMQSLVATMNAGQTATSEAFSAYGMTTCAQ